MISLTPATSRVIQLRSEAQPMPPSSESNSSSYFSTIRFPTPSSAAQTLVQTLPHPNCKICIIVPVRNEEEILDQTLNALLSQTDLAGNFLDKTSYEVILLANNCRDQSVNIAERFSRQHPCFALHVVERVFPPEEAYIGRIRQLLMDEAYQRFLYLNKPQGVIASTDGDSQVSPTWIAAIHWEIEQGVDAVGGRIVTDAQSRNTLDWHARRYFLQEVGYRSLIAELESYLDPERHDPFPRHYQHYGASLAVTASAYAQAGGMAPVRTPEDEAFYQALKRVDARFRHSPLVRVTTSARQMGRSPVGLANQLQQWSMQKNQSFWVEPAAAIATRFHARYHLRQLWQRVMSDYIPPQSEIAQLANVFQVDNYWLTGEVTKIQTFGALFEQVEKRQHDEGHWRNRWALVDVKQAIDQLRRYLESLRQGRILEGVK